MMKEEYPTGFRFYPTEEELISFYLQNQLQGTLQDRLHRVITVRNIYNTEPWNLPQDAGELCRGDLEQWFFFVPLQEREARGGRPSRSMPTGYWKATGSPSYVYSADDKAIGVKKSMVFYLGKAPTGRKTKWKLNEYRAFEVSSNISVRRLRHEYTLCRLYVVSGSSRAFDRRPRNMAAREMTQGSGNSGGVHGRVGAASTSSVVIPDDHAGSSSHGGMAAVTSAEEEPISLDWEPLNWDEFLSP